MKQVQVALSATIALQRCFSRASLCMMSCTLLVTGNMLAWSGIATAQQKPSTVERQKVELEVARLTKDVTAFPAWLTGILTVLVAAASSICTVWVVRRETFGALDQSVHEKRLELYPKLVSATAPLALYFPPQKSVGPAECCAIGEALRTWYFDGGGILLSVEARNSYFKFARALTRASLAPKLAVPVFPEDSQDVSAEKVKKYKEEFVQELNADCAEDAWYFGSATSHVPAQRFKDFVFLQHLSSTLRTKLSEDLRSRRRPAT